MTSSKDPYKRRATKPIPRVDLAPVSSRALEDEAVPETLVPCPACNGGGLVSHDDRRRLVDRVPELAETHVTTPDEPPKDAA